MTGYILLGVVVLLLVGAVTIYNRLVTNKNMVAEGWSGIDVQLKRRNDLIPNLIESVKGYMGHERGVLDQVTELRSEYAGGPGGGRQGQGGRGHGRGLANLFALAENYPDLKASQNFMELQKSLADIEDQVQLARRYYNGAAPELQHPDPVFSQQPDRLRL